jgi:RsiW-degrading membrane proteinase PrsW (M82 family)
MRWNGPLNLIAGILIGAAGTIGFMVVEDARYEYRSINSYPAGEERRRMFLVPTSCMPIAGSNEQLWFRCPRLRLFP